MLDEPAANPRAHKLVGCNVIGSIHTAIFVAGDPLNATAANDETGSTCRGRIGGTIDVEIESDRIVQNSASDRSVSTGLI